MSPCQTHPFHIAPFHFSAVGTCVKIWSGICGKGGLKSISSLRKYTKWYKPSKNISVGDVVVLHEDGMVPTKWPLGRVTQTFSGQDGLVRVANVKTPSLDSTPYQTLTFLFSKRAFGKSKVVNRSFQPSWSGLWPFLHYDEANDSVFCHTCLMAFKLECITSSCADPAFVSYSYSNLIIPKVLGYFKYNPMIQII